jgi:hypothetical protein
MSEPVKRLIFIIVLYDYDHTLIVKLDILIAYVYSKIEVYRKLTAHRIFLNNAVGQS